MYRVYVIYYLFALLSHLLLKLNFIPISIKNLYLNFVNKEKIRVIAFNPLVRGSYVKSLHAAANLNLLDEENVKEIGKKYNKTSG